MLPRTRHTVCTWETQTGERLKAFDHEKSVTAVCYVLGPPYLVSVSFDVIMPVNQNTVKVWNLDSAECQQTLTEHNNGIMSLCPSPDGSQFASGDLDGKIIVYREDEVKKAR